MSKRLHIVMSDSTHMRLRRMATESGLTNAKLVELALEFYERECGAALRQMRQVEVPTVEPVITEPIITDAEPQEPAPTPDTPGPDTTPETPPAGQPAPSAAADDDWWRDILPPDPPKDSA